MKLKFKFVDRGRHGHVVLFVMCFQHLFLEQEVHPVSDDQCYKLDEDLCTDSLYAARAENPRGLERVASKCLGRGDPASSKRG